MWIHVVKPPASEILKDPGPTLTPEVADPSYAAWRFRDCKFLKMKPGQGKAGHWLGLFAQDGQEGTTGPP